jgi:nitrogen-specific signal transduction histidine kinase
MKPSARIYHIPLLAATGMLLALTLWVLWSWQGYAERAIEWRRQRAQDTFETLNAVVASMSNGELTDWKQVETVLSSIIRGSRTLFVVVQGRHGRLIETGAPPDFLMTNSTRGEMTDNDMHVLWAPLKPVYIPSNWSEALNATHLGLGRWPHGNPIMYLGMRGGLDSFTVTRFWERQGPIVASALACILAVTAVWIAGIRRRILAGALAAERLRSAHLEELGLAAAGLAHETKNPLGIIMGMAQQIAAQPGIPAESRAMLEHIMDEVDKASSRLGNFMNFARQRTPDLTAVRVDQLCREVAEIMGPDFEAGGVELCIEVPRTSIVADGTMLRQILVNLLLNSLHASPPGTTTRVFLLPHGRRLALAVEDQGLGIAPELLPDIFKPYTSGSTTGHGLGLAIVKRMVEAHGWRIQPASTPPRGTTMTISGIKHAKETI